MIQLLVRLLAAIACLGASVPSAMAQQRGPLVLAAASLQESLTDAADAWAAQGNPRPVLSFAASSALARQIASGAPADLFISADEPWMNDVQKRGLVRPGSRVSFLANRLVLVAPRARPIRLPIARGFPIAKALGGGRLAMADPDTVPAGRYGRTALTSLGVWPQVADRVARAENVRAALALVERGEAPLGIVYTTDARVSRTAIVIGTFPANSHPPITYPVAALKAGRNPATAEAFRRFLISRAGRAIFVRYGFAAR